MKRIENPELLRQLHGRKCEISSCVKAGEVHHIITRSRGGPDVPWNLMTLCPLHHRGEWHDKGVRFMLDTYPELIKNLYDRGFQWEPHFGKLFPPTVFKTMSKGHVID